MSTKSPNLTPNSSYLSSHSQTSEDHNYRPSVPIFIYRQLVEELQKTQLKLETLKAQNQALVAQNEALKKEVNLIFNSAQNLQAILQKKDSFVQLKTESQRKTDLKNHPQLETKPKSFPAILSKETSVKPLKKVPTPKSHRQKYTLEVDFNLSNAKDDTQKSRKIKGFWLMIMIVFLVFSCFVGSFFVAKSFLNDNNNSR